MLTDDGTVNFMKSCIVKDCVRKMHARQLCGAHYKRFLNGHDVHSLVRSRPGPKKGSRINRPIGEWRLSSNGYILRKNKGVCESHHRFVMEDILGRDLLPGENVHHKNGLKWDNRPENLELWVVTQPSGQRSADLVDWAIELLRRYAPDKLGE